LLDTPSSSSAYDESPEGGSTSSSST
jgi:hypothetical protein